LVDFIGHVRTCPDASERVGKRQVRAAPAFTVSIPASREEAIKAAEELGDDELVVFTDGSGYEEGVGAAAWCMDKNGQAHIRRWYLGSAADHTVFEGEVVGAILAMDIAKTTPRHSNRLVILLDNQAAIQALHANRPQPGQYLLRTFHAQLNSLLKTRPNLRGKVHLAWIPGHEGVEGNEAVDAEAKSAAQGDSTEVFRGKLKVFKSNLPSSAAAKIAVGKKRAREEWQEMWETSPRAARLAPIDPNPPRAAILDLYSDLTRQEGSILTQMRCRSVGLNHYLHRIGAVDSPLCPKCSEPETVMHYLLECQRFVQQRTSLRISIRGRLSLPNLLSNKNNLRSILNYFKSTGRFPLYFPSL
jgi:ribonuclease HI